MQRAAVATGRNILIRLSRLSECAILGQRDDALKARTVALQPLEVNLRQFE